MLDNVPFPVFVALLPLFLVVVFLALLVFKVVQTVMEVWLGPEKGNENAPYDPA